MKERLPLLLALAVACAVAGVAVVRRGSLRPPSATADQALTQLFRAAAQGDVKAYVDGFAGPLRESLQAALAEAGPSSFAASLRRRSQEMSGWAVAWLPGDTDPAVARLRVESVFPDRNETQDYELRRDGRAWRVVSISTAMVTRMPIPYGTAVGTESAGPAGSARRERLPSAP